MRARCVFPAVLAALVVAGAAQAQNSETVTVNDQAHGINPLHVVKVAVICHVACSGRLKLAFGSTTIGRATFEYAEAVTGKVPVTLTKAAFARIKKAPGRKMRANLTVLANGHVITNRITLKA